MRNPDQQTLCETRRVVKNNLKGCKGVKLMESVVFQDRDIYYFLLTRERRDTKVMDSDKET